MVQALIGPPWALKGRALTSQAVVVWALTDSLGRTGPGPNGLGPNGPGSHGHPWAWAGPEWALKGWAVMDPLGPMGWALMGPKSNFVSP